MRLVVLFVLLASAGSAEAEPPPRPLATFDTAKKVARDVIYAGHRTEFYCGCDYVPNHTRSGGTNNPKRCGYVPRKNERRGKVLEWEHVVPAYYLGRTRVCWTNCDKQCVNSKETPVKGRECCSRVDKIFKRMEADLHNLTPALGELNGDRSNLPFGLVKGEARQYEVCRFRNWWQTTRY